MTWNEANLEYYSQIVSKIGAFVYLFEMKKTTLLRTFGGNVRDARLKLGLTQEELGEKCGLDFRQIGFIERGEINPTLQTIHKIREGLGCSLGLLFKGL